MPTNVLQGPILPMQPWTDEEEVIKLANDSDLGLGGSVWSKDLDRAQRIADALETGSVFLNSMPKTSIWVPFTGHKESGWGSEGGPHALQTYCNQKAYHYFKAGAAGH
jgi:acyl-CoA reductase-like NAD-dependent aldehyde dehydrogenase